MGLIEDDIDKLKFGQFEHPKKQFLRALHMSLGIVTVASKKAKLSRTNHYQWVEDDPVYAAAVKDVQESVKDFGESALFNLVKDGNAAATIFFAKTRLKDRGYSENTPPETNTDQTFTFKLVKGDDLKEESDDS